MTLACALALPGCDIERPLGASASPRPATPAPVAESPIAEALAAETDGAPLELILPEIAPPERLPGLHRVADLRPRVYRLPPPPVVVEETSDERAPLLELLPPIEEEELAGDEWSLGPLPPIAEDVAEELPSHGEPSEVAIDAEKQAAVEEPLPTPAEGQPTASLLREAAPQRAFDVAEFDEDAQWAAGSSVDDVLAYFPAASELSTQFRPRVQEAFTLARHGALHAGRARFEQLLRELAQAKDASQMTSRHSRALAAGLRALEEADDFVPTGSGEIRPAEVAAGHQTPMLREEDAEWKLPHEAIAMYHLYAQSKLAAAVDGEQAGSMMLFGLGKVYSNLAERDDMSQANRKSLTMFRAAVGAHPHNHLAANEAGVLLARAGRYEQAAGLLDVAARLGGGSATYRNLAFVEDKLGQPQRAQQLRSVAERTAARERTAGVMSAERGIQWVSPDEFNRLAGSGAPAVASRPGPTNSTSAPAPAHQPQPTAKPASQQTPRQTNWW